MNEELIILLHVALASFLSGLIGLEREKVEKPAGLRTNMLVGGSVALLVSLGEIIVLRYTQLGVSEMISSDPIRIIQAIIMGVSFIGAGMVLQIADEHKIKYLTTAATILFSTGIGISVALKQYYIAVGGTLFILFVNYILGFVENKIVNRNKEKEKNKSQE